jgi:hypothetical protein
MLTDEASKEIGFVIPRLIGVDYRNLVVKLIPSYEEKIGLLSQRLDRTTQLITEKDNQLRLKDNIISDERQKVQNLEMVQEQCKKELRKKKWYKLGTIFFAGSTLATGLLLLAK